MNAKLRYKIRTVRRLGYEYRDVQRLGRDARIAWCEYSAPYGVYDYDPLAAEQEVSRLLSRVAGLSMEG